MAAIAADLDVPFAGLWLEAPEAALIARVTARRDDASDADAAVVAQQLRYDLGDLAGWHRLDASGSPEEVAQRALTCLDAGDS